MSRSDPVVIPLAKPPSPLQRPVADDRWIQAAFEYRAALLAKLLRRMPQQKLADITSALLGDLVALHHQAINQAYGRAEHD
ncbi:hypothetical protein [Aquipseudomonas campi]